VAAAVASGDIEALKLALSPRQRAFAREYIKDYNGAAAAVRAGYSPNFVDRQAYNLLHNKGIALLVDELQMSKEDKIFSVNPEYVIKEVLAVVTKETVRDGDKLRALELLARHLGMFVDRTEISGPDGGAIELENRKIEEEASDFTSLMKAMKERADRDKKDVAIV
jgi:phage terminase small subunit